MSSSLPSEEAAIVGDSHPPFDLDNSFDNESVDVNAVIAEFDADDQPGAGKIPVKKLSSAFEKCLYSQAQQSQEEANMKVFLRVRPMKNSSADSTVVIRSDTTIVTNAPESSRRAQYTKTEERHYVFSRVFGPDSAQKDVYERTTAQLLQRFLAGDNCVLFAYGMTNAGKTYTIQGTHNEPGILPRIVSAILEQMGADDELQISMLEIYQENIYDLLSKKKKDKLNIRDANGKVEVSKLSAHKITSCKEASKLMDTAASKRSKASTFLNTGSSRSHAVYTVSLTRVTDSGSNSSNSSEQITTTTAFQLVDLAGAERSNRTKATSSQQKEANNINTSLMQLWRCLQGMRKRTNDLSGSQEIIPFRESKLTHLLMPILNRAGMAGIAMVACVNPQQDDYDETLSILGNASLASKIKEISDVGRTLAQHQMSSALNGHSSTAATAIINAASIAVAAGDNASSAADVATAAAAAEGNKRRRVERTNSSRFLQPTAASNANAFAGNVSRKPHPNTKNVPIASTTAATSAADAAGSLIGAKRKLNHKDSAGSCSSLGTEGSSITLPIATAATAAALASAMREDHDVEDAVVESERKRMRVELSSLRELNSRLQQQQFTRETEIRAEVCEEMALRSDHLLQQIQHLQQQLTDAQSNGQQQQFGSDNCSSKSARKASKKKIMESARENAENDLQEAEDELLRSKMRFDKEITALRNENANLRAEMQLLRSQATTTAVTTTGSSAAADVEGPAKQQKNVRIAAEESQSDEPAPLREFLSSVAAANNNNSSNSGNNNSCSAAKEFSKRFRSKNDENAQVAVLAIKKGPFANSSPKRSPLSPVHNSLQQQQQNAAAGGNSPLRKAGYANPTASSIYRSQSPTRNTNTTVSTSASSAAAGDEENAQQLRTYGTRLRSQSQMRA